MINKLLLFRQELIYFQWFKNVPKFVDTLEPPYFVDAIVGLLTLTKCNNGCLTSSK